MSAFLFTPSGSDAEDRRVRRDYAAGRLLKVSSGIYLEPTDEHVEAVVARDWYKLVARLVPDGVVTDRTGFEVKPIASTTSSDRQVYVSAPQTRNIIKLPGLLINIREGTGPVQGDIPYLGTWLAGAERRLLDNLVSSRVTKGFPARTLGQLEVERRLEQLCRTHGISHLTHILDQAKAIAKEIGRERELIELASMITSLQGFAGAPLKSREGLARQAGLPLDRNCIDRVLGLARFLEDRAPYHIADNEVDADRLRMGAFMDAYFSNYIEGVRFDVLEAKGVIFDQAQLPGRSGDAADLAGTFQQLNNGHEPSPSNLVDAAFLDALRRCHGALMEGRQDMSPGVFKSSVNRAGNTTFVAPDLVEGTLREGLSILRSIADGFRRAMVLHYLLAEVHPFHDGNGRLARVLMNRELKAAGLSRIVVPTVFRDDYIAALRALSQRDDPSVIVRAMEFCQRVTAACVASTVTGVIQVWAQAYGFCEDGRAARLTMPSPALVVVERDGVNAPEGYWEDVSSAAFFRQ